MTTLQRTDNNAAMQIHVSIAAQRLQLREGGRVLMEVTIATAKLGCGEIRGSEQTPRGRHYVRAMIGGAAAPDTVFVGRRPTGEIYTPALRQQYPQRDWILTRILWLCGREPGRNRLGEVDTMRRYIYIHGCPDEDVLGRPGSHGCIKMRNQDIIALFARVKPGIAVDIHEGGLPAV